MKRLAIISVGVIVWSLAGTSTALAAPPNNDDIASPRTVGALPYTDGPYDTTEATTGATDPGFCYNGSIGADRATVWYAFTPADSGTYVADTFGSDFDTTLYVGTPDGAGGMNVNSCVDDSGGSFQSAVTWEGTAGTTYLIAVGTCCGFGVVGDSAGGGGSLVFHLDIGPQAATINLAVDPIAGVTSEGTAVISGTLECSPDVGFVSLGVQVVQRAGRSTITGFGGTFLFGCPSEWVVVAWSSDGPFRVGRADVTAFAFGCDAFSCAQPVVDQAVRLERTQGHVSPPVGPPPVSPPVPPPPAVSPPVCPPKGGHVTPPMGRPECPPPVSPPVSPPVTPPVSPPVSPPISDPASPPVSPPVSQLGAALMRVLWLDPAILIMGVFVGVITLGVAAGAIAASRTRRQLWLAESPQSG